MSSDKPSKGIPLALQLFSVRRQCQKDFAGTLSAVAEMGYDGVEFAGYWNTPAPQLRKMLDDAGLKAAGTHIAMYTLLGDELKKTVEFNQIIGNEFLIVPGVPAERTQTAQGWADAARLLEQAAEKVAPEGMWVGWHNHNTEFETVDGWLAWDIVYSSTRRLVMQMDIGNALSAGGDAMGFMEKHPARQQSIHLKEHSALKGIVPLGQGDVDWNAVLDFCRTSGDTRWCVVEFENDAYPAMETVKQCLDFIRPVAAGAK